MKEIKLCLGIDFGTDSVRTLLVDAENGDELAASVFEYPRWKAGLYCQASENRFRQHPADYLEGLDFTVREVLEKAPGAASQVRGISVDTTGSTPCAVNEKGLPLALLPGFAENPNAMFILWKDHTAIREADEINARCRSWGGVDFTTYSGGIYSSEWFWSKILHVLREDGKVAKAAWSWVEHCDWMPALLTGNTNPLSIKRSRCAAGHKAMWNAAWGGLPSRDFLSGLDSRMAGLRDHLYDETVTGDIPAGTLSPEWAKRFGLPGTVVVGTGALDAHIGAVGGEIEPYYLSKVMGTSTCDMLIAPAEEIGKKLIRGICGQVDGSIIPGMTGMEAGQSAFGDVYAWFRDVLMWPLENVLPRLSTRGINMEGILPEIRSGILAELSLKASVLPAGGSGILALDWMNGRRTPDANQHLRGAITGLTLGSDAPAIFRALVEATTCGARKIVERFGEEGVPIKGIIALGGIAKKSPFVMQVLSDVLNKPIKVVRSEQTCALGAAMFAAVVAGIYPDIREAPSNMGKGFETTYHPIQGNVVKYERLYEDYSALGGYIERGTI
jgi:L-ribulokinase